MHAKDNNNPFQKKVDSGLIKVFRIRQCTDYRGMTVADSALSAG